MSDRGLSVIIRTRDEAASIGRVLELLAAQTRPPDEVIVVDSGSTDATLAIARRAGARVLAIAPEDFTFGGALNTGCAAACGRVLVALSAHAFPRDAGWLARLEAHFGDPRVACVTGADHGPDGSPLRELVLQDADHVRRHPRWGYSNTAGAVRAELWRRRPFREDLPASEDKEWALHWLRAGKLAALDPELMVEHDHSRDPPREQYRRSRIEWAAMGAFLPLAADSLPALVREWWTDADGHRSRWRARGNPRRLAKLAGKRSGQRSWSARRGDVALRIAVLVEAFPVVSETFATAEVAALRALGHHVVVEAVTRGTSLAPDVLSHYLEDDTRTARGCGLLWLAARCPRRVGVDLLRRRRWRGEEDVRPLRALSARALRLRSEGVQHLHVHFANQSAQDGLRLASLLGTTCSITAHAYEIFLDPRNLPRKLTEATFATTGCEYNLRHLRGLVDPGTAPRIHEIVMGVDPGRFARRTPHPGGRHVVAVGRLVEKKGFADLVDAAALLEGEAPLERVTIVGDGPLHATLLDRIEARGLGHRVVLAGERTPTDIRELLETADVLAMPCVVAANGDRDSMPVVVKEALAMEVPVVATHEVGLPELVRPGWGRLVPPGDPAALAGALAELLELDPDERRRMGRAGRQWVTEHADVARETARLAELIRAGSRR